MAKVKLLQVDVDGDLFRECVDAIERIGGRTSHEFMESVATVDEILEEVNAKPREYMVSRGPTRVAFYRRSDVVKVLNKALSVGFVYIAP